jgi:hypothetical protein
MKMAANACASGVGFQEYAIARMAAFCPNSITPESSLPQVGQVRWGRVLMDLTGEA